MNKGYPDLEPDWGEIWFYTLLTLLALLWPTFPLYFLLEITVEEAATLTVKWYTLPLLLGVYIWALLTSSKGKSDEK